MRTRILTTLLRVTFSCWVAALLTIGPIGCDGGSAPATGTTSKLPPEAEQANKNMENHMKTQQKK